MKSLTTETALDILIAWLQDNIDCESGIIFDNDDAFRTVTTCRILVEQITSVFPAPTAASATEPVSLTHQTSFH